MADEESKFLFPKDRTLSCKTLALLKGALGIIPIAGATCSELLGYFLQRPLQRRQEQWFEFIGQSLEDVIERLGTLEEIISNDNFIDMAIKATKIALTTTKQEKINALKNAVLNSTINNNFDEIKQQVFIALLDQFNEYHIEFLKLLDGQMERVKEINFNNYDGSYMLNPNFFHLIAKIFPNLDQKEDFCKIIMNDLFYKNLTTTQSYDFPLTNDNYDHFVVGNRTTTIGKEFLNFISEPKFQ
ncbi:MAG: hypothetical protein LBO66_05900 [Deltaproteobacteria bacterium]|jgi:hypothetical protein|nr:hypothetical protein [Deltaproteobacteria bacterium]